MNKDLRYGQLQIFEKFIVKTYFFNRSESTVVHQKIVSYNRSKVLATSRTYLCHILYNNILPYKRCNCHSFLMSIFTMNDWCTISFLVLLNNIPDLHTNLMRYCYVLRPPGKIIMQIINEQYRGQSQYFLFGDQIVLLIYQSRVKTNYHTHVGSQIILSTILAIQNNNHTQNTNIYVKNSLIEGKEKYLRQFPNTIWLVNFSQWNP